MFKHKTITSVFLFIGAAAILLALFGVVSWYWFFALTILWIALTAWGVFDIRQSYFTDVFYKRKHSDGKSIALTFDDGPTAITDELLDLLQRHRAKATFFCIGKQIKNHPVIFQRIIAEGHTVANHTMHHSPFIGFFSTDRVMQEIRSCDEVIQHLTTVNPKLFRPPYGVTNPLLAKAVKQTKHQVIGWSNRSLDTVMTDENKIYDRVISRLKAGDIVLFHDTTAKTLRVVERVLLFMEAQNLQSVTVDKLLNLYAYEQ